MSKQDNNKSINKKIDVHSKPMNNKGNANSKLKPYHRNGKSSRSVNDADLSYSGNGQHSTSSGKGNQTPYKGNDIEWYKRVPNLLDTAKQVAYNIPLGVKLKSTNAPIPGVIALDYAPIAGYSESTLNVSHTYSNEAEFYDVWASTPFNIAMRESYSKVRSSKGGSRPYDYPDLAEMLLSAASIYAYIIHLQRVLKCVNRFNFQNKYLGETLVNAMGFEYGDLVANYVTYVGRLNLLVEKAKTVAIPKGLAVLDEWLWRNSNIFKDTNTDNIKQQYIVDVPNGYYIYDEAHGDAIFKPVLVSDRTFNNYLSMTAVLGDLETAVAQLWNSETFALLMGDLRFAYKDEVISIPQMGLNDTVDPVWNLDHSIEVQNMNFLSTVVITGTTEHMWLLDSNLAPAILETALSMHQDLRSATLNNGAVFAGPAFNPTSPTTKLRGYKILLIAPQQDAIYPFSATMTSFHNGGFDDYSFVSLYSDVPDGDTLVYATRMKMVWSIVNQNGETEFTTDYNQAYAQIRSSTACLWLGPRICLEPKAARYNESYIGFRVYNVISNGVFSDPRLSLLFGLSNFNIAPKTLFYIVDQTNPKNNICHVLGDIEVASDMSVDALAMLQAVCLYSQWLIPDTVDVSGFTPKVLTK